MFPIDGAHQRLPNDDSAVGNRDAGAVLDIGASWERAEDDAANIEWARGVRQGSRRVSPGGVYVNFLTEDEGADRIRAWYGANLERLARVKSVWDPDEVFRLNRTSSPGSDGSPRSARSPRRIRCPTRHDRVHAVAMGSDP